MATGYTKGFLYRARFAQSQLESMLDDARQTLLASGPESIVNWSDNATSMGKRIEMTAAEWIDELIYSLALLDPGKYGDRFSADMTTPAFPGRFT